MVKLSLVICFSLFVMQVSAQTVAQKLQKAYRQFETDTQLKNAISSLYIIDATTGKVVFDKNSRIGLAPASTQKIITAATAFELLGDGYGYKTWIYLDGKVSHDSLLGNFIIKGSGDPTFGSPRYEVTKPAVILESLTKLLKDKNIKYISGDVIIDDFSFESSSVPEGWIWQDIGNYYGAGAYAFNWNENQYDMILKAGPSEGSPVEIVKIDSSLNIHAILNELTAGPKTSGDNAYIYLPPYSINGFVRGTIPAGAQNFPISGSLPYPAYTFSDQFTESLEKAGIKVNGKFKTRFEYTNSELKYNVEPTTFYVSPSLVEMTKWFLQKSINLYGEAFVKTFAFEKKKFGSSLEGLKILKDHWKQKGIEETELNMNDGSGLSPQNRVTTHAQVEILKYAKKQSWFQYYYAAFPEYNNMKIKSGTIKDVKGFCGYHTAKDGKSYIFSFLVNNYNGPSGALVNKMYTVLNVLK